MRPLSRIVGPGRLALALSTLEAATALGPLRESYQIAPKARKPRRPNGRPMNPGLQADRLRATLRAQGVAWDTIDVRALIDPTLHLGENRALLMRHAGLSETDEAQEDRWAQMVEDHMAQEEEGQEGPEPDRVEDPDRPMAEEAQPA